MQPYKLLATQIANLQDRLYSFAKSLALERKTGRDNSFAQRTSLQTHSLRCILSVNRTASTSYLHH